MSTKGSSKPLTNFSYNHRDDLFGTHGREAAEVIAAIDTVLAEKVDQTPVGGNDLARSETY